MSEHRWIELRDKVANAFNAYPDAAGEQTLIDTFQVAPAAVATAVAKVVQRVQAGRLQGSAGWMIVAREMANIARPAPDVVTTDVRERDRALTCASRWIQHAGLHFPSEDELIDALCGERGMLQMFDNDDTRARIVACYRKLRPAGERLERELEERARNDMSTGAQSRRAPSEAHRLAGKVEREAA